MVENNVTTVAQVYDLLATIPDPEVPVLNVLDLGIVRKVELVNATHIIVTITPTYSGCPAMDVIAMQIKMEMRAHGFTTVDVLLVLTPTWTTDWITPEGKIKLKQYGIAPPQYNVADNTFNTKNVPCPRCDSTNTVVISEFASTACKSMYKCIDCLEPFDYFKCH